MAQRLSDERHGLVSGLRRPRPEATSPSEIRRLLAAACAIMTMTTAIVLVGATRAVAATAVPVPATQAWTDTGIDVDVAGEVTLEADGTIIVGGPEGNLGPAGSTAGCVASNSQYSGQWVANGFPCWSLIARVGDYAPFMIGEGGTFMVPAGRLFLGVNDEVAAFGDNSGSWTVQVSVAPATTDPHHQELQDVAKRISDLLDALNDFSGPPATLEQGGLFAACFAYEFVRIVGKVEAPGLKEVCGLGLAPYITQRCNELNPDSPEAVARCETAFEEALGL